jgi:ParB-like chromosome segregation protein Spo0J
MPKIALRKIVVDPTIQIRRSNHEPTIRRYAESFEKLPPVELFDTPDGLLLADGFHRVAAAERLGLSTIDAKVRKGSRKAALEFAVVSNTKNADPLTPDERDDGIRRHKQLHPEWSQRQIAETMSVSQATIQRVFKIDEVKQATFPTSDSRESPTDRHYREIAKAPKEQWQPLVQATQKRGWSSDATALAIKNLQDNRIPAARKREIASGKADPVVITPSGEFAVPAEVVGRQIRDMEANDAVLAFQRALEYLAKVRLFRVDAVLGDADARLLKTWAREVPGDIAWLQELVDSIGTKGKLRAVGRK